LKLLIDTHVLIWSFSDPERLPPTVRSALGSPLNRPYVSVVCLWEIAIKLRSGKLTAPLDLPEQIADHPAFDLLEITAAPAWRVRRLPTLHRDPFDQLLIAQAFVEGMTIVTHDRMIKAYGVPIIAA